MEINIEFTKFLSRSVGDEMILLNPENGEMFKLNQSGQTIWNHLQKNHSLTEISQILCKKYELKPNEATEIVSEFLEDIKKAIS